MKAIVLQDLHLLGTDIKFKKGQRVIAVPATNQPEPNAHLWFIHKRGENNRSMLVKSPGDIWLVK